MTTHNTERTDTESRKKRADITRTSIMRAAEKLFAKNGIENVSVRAIIKEAGQKNESALQYHFKNRQGLIEAINIFRQTQVDRKRGELYLELLNRTPTPTLREVCSLLVEPVFLLAKSDPGIRQWLKAFSHGYASWTSEALKRNWSSLGNNTKETAKLLRSHMNHINSTVADLRVLNAMRFIALSLSQQASEKNAFRNKDSDLFYHVLLDGITASFCADLSAETQKAVAVKEKIESH
jgi:AcrR family transcriptional regulator